MDGHVQAGARAKKTARSRSALRWAALVLAAVVVGVWLSLTPAGLLGKADAVGYAVCHRIDLRSFHIGERAMPLCARCSGMYLGLALAVAYPLARGRGKAGAFPPKIVMACFALFGVFFAIDGLNSYSTLFSGKPLLYPPRNEMRLATGLLMGLAMGSVVYAAFNQSAWRAWLPQSGLRSWRELPALLALAALTEGAVLSQNPLILYPLALVSSLSLLGMLTAVYTIGVLLILGRENRADSWRDLFFPLLAGLTLAFIQVGIIDAIRFAITGTWNGLTL